MTEGKVRASQWCMIVMRNVRCGSSESDETVNVEDPVTVYGPFTQAEANARANEFNKACCETAEGEPFYRPVAVAPPFLDQEKWPEHWAIVRPMNDVVW